MTTEQFPILKGLLHEIIKFADSYLEENKITAPVKKEEPEQMEFDFGDRPEVEEKSEIDIANLKKETVEKKNKPGRPSKKLPPTPQPAPTAPKVNPPKLSEKDTQSVEAETVEEPLIEEATIPVVAEAIAPNGSVKTYTQEELLEKYLKPFAAKKGLPAARALLLKFGAARLSELPATSYQAFVDEVSLEIEL